MGNVGGEIQKKGREKKGKDHMNDFKSMSEKDTTILEGTELRNTLKTNVNVASEKVKNIRRAKTQRSQKGRRRKLKRKKEE